jgi:hypothetical protein
MKGKLRVIAIGVLRITEGEASQLVNKTVPIPGDPGHYAISLSVFHQLHCLVRYIPCTSVFMEVDSSNYTEHDS